MADGGVCFQCVLPQLLLQVKVKDFLLRVLQAPAGRP